MRDVSFASFRPLSPSWLRKLEEMGLPPGGPCWRRQRRPERDDWRAEKMRRQKEPQWRPGRMHQERLRASG